MPLRLLADAGAQSTIPGALTSGATSFVGQSTALFPQPQNFGNGATRLTILDAGNAAWNPAAPLATPYEYCSYTNNNTGANTISGLTRGEAGTTAKNFSAGAIFAVAWLAEDIMASAPWKFDEQTPTSGGTVTIPSAGTIPASYLGVTWRHIQIVWQARDNSANTGDVLMMTFNGDSTANYDDQLEQISGTTVTTAASVGVTSLRVGVAAGGTSSAGLFNSGTVWVKYFSSTGFRRSFDAECFRADSFGFEDNAGAWRNTANAINQIAFALGAGTYVGPSIFTTYLWP